MYEAYAYTTQKEVDPSHLKINKPLTNLTVMEVCNLLQHLSIEVPFEVIHRHQINGELLSLIVNPLDLNEMGIQIPVVKARLLMKRIETYKVEGVPGPLLLPMVQPSFAAPPVQAPAPIHYYPPNLDPNVGYFQMAKVQADHGNMNGQFNLAICYDQGKGVPVDKAKAFHFYKLAADRGHAQAQCNVGFCYYRGIGISKNRPEAFRYYRLSADQGYEGGIFNTAMCYWKGKGVSKDVEQAFLYFELAAALGNMNALTNLGYCYDKGVGTEVNKIEAFRCYQQAADQGQNPTAQYCVGVYMWSGEGNVLVNRQLAFEYWKRAADQGLTLAQRAVAKCYANGDGVMKNKREANRYYDLAAASGGGLTAPGCPVS